MNLKTQNHTHKSDGYAIAEFAITIPALISVCALCFWVIGLSVSKLQLENLVSNAARIAARGEPLDPKLFESAPLGTSLEVITNADQIRVEAILIKEVPFLKNQIELKSAAESISEFYVLKE